MADEHTLVLKHFDPVDRRLGRHVAHDSRSLRFRAPAKDPRKLASVRHVVNVPIMDQGMEGSCTGHAGTANLGHPHFWAAGRIAIGLNDPHDYAVGLYSAATEIDAWQGTFRPDDTGSDGLSIAKVLHARGLISGYQHATSLAATLTALEQRVVMVGTSWLEGMYDTAPDGQMTVSGMELGGHEYALDELDVERQRVWIRNSWGEGYGLRGRAWMTWDDLAKLLAMQGDCTVLIPLAEPPPQPTPEPPPKPARPIEDVQLAQALTKFIGTTSVPKYVRTAAVPWLKTKE